MSLWHRWVSLLSCLALVGASVAGCGEEPPELPPADSMEFGTMPTSETSGGLTAVPASRVNAALATGSVFLVTATVELFMFTPRLAFAVALQAKPTHKGNEWIWTRSAPGWQVELHALKAERLELSMHLTGLTPNNNDVQDFVWYTGSHSSTEGNWTIYNGDTVSGAAATSAAISIDWSKTSDTEKSVTFTNVCTDCSPSGKLGDSLAYALNGTTASMTIHDAHSGDHDDGPAEDFSVVWDTVDGSGRITIAGGQPACWGTLANGQADIVCP